MTVGPTQRITQTGFIREIRLELPFSSFVPPAGRVFFGIKNYLDYQFFLS